MTSEATQTHATPAPRAGGRRFLPEGVWIRALSLLALIAVWQLGSMAFTQRYVPGPLLTFSSMWELLRDGEIPKNFVFTMSRMAGSFVIAMTLGTVLGTLMGLYRRGEQMLDMWIMVGLTIPSLCYIIVSFMWLGLNDRGAMLAISWTTFPSITINIWQGVKAIDQRLIDMARVFRCSGTRRILRVVIPQVLPYLMAAARFGLGVVWKVTVFVEVLGGSNGVGYMLNYSFQMFNMADVFAWTISFTIVMLAIELLILKPIETRLFSWRPDVRA